MIREYKKEDFEEVSSWFHKRNLPISIEMLPKHGFIEPGTAAGFIYLTDSNFSIFECFIRNPDKSFEECNLALNTIVTHMIEKSRELGFREVWGFVTSQNMLRRGIEQGFDVFDMCTMIRKIL